MWDYRVITWPLELARSHCVCSTCKIRSCFRMCHKADNICGSFAFSCVHPHKTTGSRHSAALITEKHGVFSRYLSIEFMRWKL